MHVTVYDMLDASLEGRPRPVAPTDSGKVVTLAIFQGLLGKRPTRAALLTHLLPGKTQAVLKFSQKCPSSEEKATFSSKTCTERWDFPPRVFYHSSPIGTYRKKWVSILRKVG